MVIQLHEASSPVFPLHPPVNITEDIPKVSLFALPSRGWADPGLSSSPHMPQFPDLQPPLQFCSTLTEVHPHFSCIREPQAESITTNKASPVLDRGELFSSTCYLRSMQPTRQPCLNSLLLQAQLPPHQAQVITRHLDDGFFPFWGKKGALSINNHLPQEERESGPAQLFLFCYWPTIHSQRHSQLSLTPNEIKIKCNTCQVDILLQYT